MKLKCIIIDDELHAIEGLESYINTLPALELIKTYTDPLLALTEISEGEPVDMIFMDVDMPRINGIELGKVLRHKTDKLIYTTAHTKYAFDAYQVNANAFLHKPYTLIKFIETVNRFFTDFSTKPVGQKIEEEQEFFFVRSRNDNNLIKIRYPEIIAVESLLNYIRIYTVSQDVVTYMTMSEIKTVLHTYSTFMQVHRSFIISKNHIEKVEGNMLKMSNSLVINVGNMYRDAVQSFIMARTLKSNRG